MGGIIKDASTDRLRLWTALSFCFVFPPYLWFSISRTISLPALQLFSMVLVVLCIHTWLVCSPLFSFVVSFIAVAAIAWSWLAYGSNELFWSALILLTMVPVIGYQKRYVLRIFLKLEQKIFDRIEQRRVNEDQMEQTNKLNEAQRIKLQRLTHLQSVAERFSKDTSLDNVSNLAVETAFQLIGKSGVSALFIVDGSRRNLSLVASKKKANITALPRKDGDELDHFVLRTQRPLLIEDLTKDYRFRPAYAGRRRIRSLIACPLMSGTQIEGLLRLDSSRANTYSQDDLRLLDILATLSAAAVNNARLFAEVQRLATTDGLTGLWLKAPMQDHLEKETLRTSRSKVPLSLLMIDVDHFKHYNDTFGHASGDNILTAIGRIIQRVLPDEAYAARFGGEEFAIILPHINLRGAIQIAEQIRFETQNTLFDPSAEPKPVTVSIGIAEFLRDAMNALELIRAADARLYKAKSLGRNRICYS